MNKKGTVLGLLLVAMLVLGLAVVGVVPAPGIGEKEFLVKDFSPDGTVEGRTEIRVIFNREAAPAEKIGKDLSPSEMPFLFSPAITGKGRWIDALTFVYYPKAGLLSKATAYIATARHDLRDRDGRLLSGASSFTFRTPPLRFIQARQVDFDPNTSRTTFELEFSLPVSPARLRGYAEVRDASNRPLEFQIRQGPVSRKITLIVASPSDVKNIRLDLAAGLPSESGPLGLEKSHKIPLSRSMVMEVRDSNAVSNMNNGEIYIETTAPVDFAKAGSFVEVSPKSAYTFEPRDRGFALVGSFAPQDRVKVTLKKGFPSLDGKPLAAEWNRAFIFPEKKPEIRFTAPGRILSPAGDLRIPIETVNIDSVHILVWKLYENNIPIGMRSSWSEYPMDLSAMLADKIYKVKSSPSKKIRSALDLKPLIGDGKGVYLVIAQNADNENGWADSRQIVNVTDLGVTLKNSPDSALFWVNSVKQGKAVAGAKVTLWSWSNQPLGEGTTDKNGLASVSLKEAGAAAEQPVLATVKKDGDVAFIRLENGLYSGKDAFDISGKPWLYSGYDAYCYMPRDIFRPGENIPVRAVIRDVKNLPPEPFPVTLKVISSMGKEWTTQTVKLSKEGTLSALIKIPAGAPTGIWWVNLCTPGNETPVGTKEFFIEEFAAPRLSVETTVTPKLLVGEQSATLSISSKYVFGSPASELPWEADLSVMERQFAHKDWKGFSFTDVEKKFQPDSESIGSGKLDKAGKATVSVKGRMRTVPSIADIVIGTGVIEEGGRRVYKTTTVQWYPSDVLVGIALQSDEAAPNKPLVFKTAAVTPEGAAAKTEVLKYSFFRVIEHAITYEEYGTRRSRVQEELLPRGEGSVQLASGKGSGSVKPTEGGKYLLRVEDPKSGARASAWIYVYGSLANTESTVLPDRVNITTDKEKYRAGETAKIKVEAPFTGTLLLDVETYRVVHREVRELKAKETEFSIKITEDMAPNAWLTAQLVRSAPGSPKDAARAYGAAPIKLDNSDKKLTVSINKPGVVKPGKNEFSLTVKDAQNRAAEAEVTVMLVDEAILGLTGYSTPDPWNFFTAQRTLGVDTFDIYDVLITPEARSTPLLTAGGGAGAEMMMKNSSLNPVQAKRFKMMSLIKTLRTDSKGVCNFSFVIPEFAGKARLMAVAVNKKAAGSASVPVEINREIVLEPSMPRVLAPGDTFTVPCQLFNRGKKAEDVSLKVECTGPVKLIGTSDFKTALKPAAEASFPLSFKGTGSGKAKVVFTARWPGGVQRSEIEISVRPAAPRITKSWFGIIEPGKSADIKLPDGWFMGTLGGRVMLSAMPSVSLSDLSRFLITYPHGCLEQTVSSAWPLLVQPDLAKTVDPSLADANSVKGALSSRIQRIIARQNYDGGFFRWPGDSWSQPWDSIYSVHFLVEAKKAGVKVPSDALKSALGYVRRQLSITPSEPGNDSLWRETLTRRAYSCYVLALAGDAPLGWMESLRDKADSLDPSGRLLLAAAYAVSGQKKEASQMLGRKLELIKHIPGRNENYDSDLRNKALYLLAQASADPSSPNAASAAAALMAELRRVKSYNTQEGALSLVALAKYFHAQPIQGAPSGVLSAGGKTVGRVTEKTLAVSAGVKELTPFKAENTGKAKLFAAWSLSGIPVGKVVNQDNGIEARNLMLDKDGKPIGKIIPRGAALTASITVKPKAGGLRDVVVIVPLAAGLEIENARFTGTGEALPPDVRAEARDDRLLLYIDRLEKPLVWRYKLRAVTAGVFDVPQISAECMYDPAVSSISGGGKLEIK